MRVMGHLYDQDLVLWSEEQAQALREAAQHGCNAPMDREHVAEEIESLGRSERNAVGSFLGLIIEHLLKLQASPASDPIRGWRDTVRRGRRDLEPRLKDSPSLRRDVPDMIVDEMTEARVLVRDKLKDHGEQPLIDLDQVSYTADQVLGDWLSDRSPR